MTPGNQNPDKTGQIIALAVRRTHTGEMPIMAEYPKLIVVDSAGNPSLWEPPLILN